MEVKPGRRSVFRKEAVAHKQDQSSLTFISLDSLEARQSVGPWLLAALLTILLALVLFAPLEDDSESHDRRDLGAAVSKKGVPTDSRTLLSVVMARLDPEGED